MDSIVGQIFLQLILIFLNAFFAATEIAVLSINKVKLNKMAEEGDKTAKRLLKLTEQPANFLSTIQVGITLAGFLGSAFAADNFSGYLVNWVYYDLGFTSLSLATLDTLALIVITIILSYFTLVLGELVPKRIAMQKGYGVAKFTSGIVYGISKVMRPVIWFLSVSTNLVLKLFRMNTNNKEDTVTEEEIKMMIDAGSEEGNIEESEKEWIKNVFEFNDTLVREIMTPSQDIEYIDFDSNNDEIEECIRESGYTRMPVCGEEGLNDIVGILNIKDYFLNKNKSFKELLRTPYFVPDTTLADDLLNNLRKTKNNIAILVNEYGTTVGLITIEDLLEEIVGDIYDEYDIDEETKFKEIEKNVYLVSGNLLINELEGYLNINVDDEHDFDTLGGFLLSCLGYIPADGTHSIIKRYGYTFKIKTIENHRIKEVIVKKNK